MAGHVMVQDKGHDMIGARMTTSNKVEALLGSLPNDSHQYINKHV